MVWTISLFPQQKNTQLLFLGQSMADLYKNGKPDGRSIHRRAAIRLP
jgi:hypothetical protein